MNKHTTGDELMSLPRVNVETAKRLVDQGATLVDIRGRDEHARQFIPGACNFPVSEITTLNAPTAPVVFYCRTGQRTAANAQRLAGAVQCEAYILDGGIDAWKQAGLPIVADRNQPIEIQRQVQNRGQTGLNTLQGPDSHPAQSPPIPTGRAEGAILQGGQGLQGCEIQLVRIFKARSIFSMRRFSEESTTFTAITDDRGMYAFDKLPVGAYKLRWQLPNDKGWIRRLKDKPDAIVKEGQTAILTSVETNRRLVSR